MVLNCCWCFCPSNSETYRSMEESVSYSPPEVYFLDSPDHYVQRKFTAVGRHSDSSPQSEMEFSENSSYLMEGRGRTISFAGVKSAGVYYTSSPNDPVLEDDGRTRSSYKEFREDVYDVINGLDGWQEVKRKSRNPNRSFVSAKGGLDSEETCTLNPIYSPKSEYRTVPIHIVAPGLVRQGVPDSARQGVPESACQGVASKETSFSLPGECEKRNEVILETSERNNTTHEVGLKNINAPVTRPLIKPSKGINQTPPDAQTHNPKPKIITLLPKVNQKESDVNTEVKRKQKQKNDVAGDGEEGGKQNTKVKSIYWRLSPESSILEHHFSNGPLSSMSSSVASDIELHDDDVTGPHRTTPFKDEAATLQRREKAATSLETSFGNLESSGNLEADSDDYVDDYEVI